MGIGILNQQTGRWDPRAGSNGPLLRRGVAIRVVKSTALPESPCAVKIAPYAVEYKLGRAALRGYSR